MKMRTVPHCEKPIPSYQLASGWRALRAVATPFWILAAVAGVHSLRRRFAWLGRSAGTDPSACSSPGSRLASILRGSPFALHPPARASQATLSMADSEASQPRDSVCDSDVALDLAVTAMGRSTWPSQRWTPPHSRYLLGEPWVPSSNLDDSHSGTAFPSRPPIRSVPAHSQSTATLQIVPLCPLYVPSRSPLLANQTLMTWSLLAVKSRSPSLLKTIWVRER